MTMRVHIQLLAFEHYWSILTGSCLTTLLYSPDLAPIYYNLFTYLENWLESERFSNNEELMEGFKMWLSSQAADFFDTGIKKLLEFRR
jgi:hypothetical protein